MSPKEQPLQNLAAAAGIQQNISFPREDIAGLTESQIRALVMQKGKTDGTCELCNSPRKAITGCDGSLVFNVYICKCTPETGRDAEEAAERLTPREIIVLSGIDQSAIEDTPFVVHDGNKEAVKALFPPAGDFRAEPPMASRNGLQLGAWIAGNQCSGKTRLAFELIRQYAEHGRYAWYLNTDLLATQLPHKDNETGIRRMIDRAEKIDLLILDGLGRRNFGWQEADQVFRVLSARAAKGLRTVYFSRLVPGDCVVQLQPSKSYPPLYDVIQKGVTGNGRFEFVFYGIKSPQRNIPSSALQRDL